MYGCESWTVKKFEHRRIDAFELWCWRRFLRVPYTARRTNQYILKEISPRYSLVGLMLKAEAPILWPPDAKSWLIWKDPDGGKDWRQVEKRTTEDEMVGWHHWLNGPGFGWTSGGGDGQEAWRAVVHGVAKSRTSLSDWTELMVKLGFPGGTSGKEQAYQSRRHKRCGFDPWVGEIPGGGHGNPLQHSCLENLMGRGAGGLQSMGSQRVRHNWSDLACTHPWLKWQCIFESGWESSGSWDLLSQGKMCNCVRLWILITRYCGNHFEVYTYIKSLCSTPRTNMLYVNYKTEE